MAARRPSGECCELLDAVFYCATATVFFAWEFCSQKTTNIQYANELVLLLGAIGAGGGAREPSLQQGLQSPFAGSTADSRRDGIDTVSFYPPENNSET